MKLGRILVQRCGTHKHQQIAHQVPNNEAEQANPCNGHNVLSAQRSIENAPEEIHRLRHISHKLNPSTNQLKEEPSKAIIGQAP
jgi:hypothetical protein